MGRVWPESETGFVHFGVSIPAAAQSLRAAYESGTADLDYVAYEQAVDQTVRGTPARDQVLAAPRIRPPLVSFGVRGDLLPGILLI